MCLFSDLFLAVDLEKPVGLFTLCVNLMEGRNECSNYSCCTLFMLLTQTTRGTEGNELIKIQLVMA